MQHNAESRRSNRVQSRNHRLFPIEDDAAQQFRRERAVPLSIQRDEIFLFDFEARMSEPLREIAIVREQQQSFSLSIQPPNVKEPRELSWQQIENGIARVRIGSSRNESGGFVQRNRERLFCVNKLAIDFDVVALGRLRAKIGADAPIDRHASGNDELVAFAARRDAGRGKKPV